MIDGHKIRTTRKKLKLSQQELAEGITTQGTISSLERNSTSPGSNILVKLLTRLNLTLADVVVNDDIVQTDTILKNADKLSMNYEHEKVLTELEKIKKFEDGDQKVHYLFLKTDAQMWIKKDLDDAIFGFNQILLTQNQDNDIYVVLATCELGVVYSLKEDMKKASFYFEQVAKLIKQVDVEKNLFWSLLLLDNLAKYYSNTHQLTKCLTTLDHALALNKTHNTFYFVDSYYFVYAEALDKMAKSTESLKYMLKAWSFAEFLDDTLVAKEAESYLKKHKVTAFS
ncbi:helix-turn-helix domain-containing protein [Pediococcus siamensis]|uniref:helix-turn-helix domain-containing protein n=1 Tax=Pediococcus siamensis TaxID=381829 RepID=UPI0039A3AFC7